MKLWVLMPYDMVNVKQHLNLHFSGMIPSHGSSLSSKTLIRKPGFTSLLGVNPDSEDQKIS